MNTVRTPSRNSNVSSTSTNNSSIRNHNAQQSVAPPRKAKVASVAQMDLSSIALSTSNNSNSNSQGTAPPPLQRSINQQQPPSRPAIKIRSSGSVPTTSSFRNTNNNTSTLMSSRDSPVIRVSNGGGGSIGSAGNTVVRRSTASSLGVSSSTPGTIRVAGNTATAAAGGGAVLRRAGGGGIAGGDGSVTSSDDGTVSEDSVEDHIQLFSGAGAAGGGLHVNSSLPFGASSGRQGSGGGSIGVSTGLKMASSASGVGRTRVATSSTVGGSAKPMRIAAGASIRVDTTSSPYTTSSSSSGHAPIPSFALSGSSLSSVSAAPSLNVTAGAGVTSTVGNAGGSGVGLLSTSVSSSTSSSSSSLSWVSNPSSATHNNRNSGSHGPDMGGFEDVEYGYANIVTSPTSNTPTANLTNTNNLGVQSTSPGPGSGSISSAPVSQFLSQPAIRTSSSFSASASASSKSVTNSSAAAAAAKLAEENRRAEEAARTRRKIADLEISNASLLQVNQTLEATIRKQAAEVQELRMRMQSAQFGGDLSLLTSDISQDMDMTHQGTSTTPVDPEAAVIIHELTEAERQADLTFKRLCITIEQMIFEAKQAMDQSLKPAGVKVLSSFDMYEKEAMEDEAEDDDLDAADQSIVMNEEDLDELKNTAGGKGALDS